MHYFIDTFGSKGLKSFNLPYESTKLYGYPQGVTRDIFEMLSQKATEKKIETEFIHCFLNNGLKGITFPKLKKAVINIESYEERGLINSLDNGYAQSLRELGEAAGYFKEALLIHDEWEKYYIDNFNFDLIDEQCDFLIKEIFTDKKSDCVGVAYERFLGAATAFGPVDYVENLTRNIKTRYFIKGRPGTGKSTFMKKIIKYAKESGYDTECYFCAFDPKSVDMVIIRELGVCIFDSTAPHEHFPDREDDVILDFYSLASKRNVDREYKEELVSVAARYKEKIKMATECIGRCNNIIRQNEKLYIERIDRKNIICLTEVLAAEIFGG